MGWGVCERALKLHLSRKDLAGKAKAKTGIGKSDLPGLQGGPRKRDFVFRDQVRRASALSRPGARMRGAISKSGDKTSLAEEQQYLGGQGVHREMESEGHAEKYRAVIDGETQDEPVGQRWGKVEPALLGRRHSHSPTAPRCLRAARYGRTTRDLRRTGRVSGWHRSKRTYKRERSGEPRSVSSRTAEYYL